MHPTAQTTEALKPPAPPKERATLPCIAFLLDVVRVLLGYGRKLDDTIPTQAGHPRFPILAAGFGTHDVGRILAHVQRGILRAMMLQKYLLARAAQNRDIEPARQAERAEPAAIEALDLKLGVPDRVRSKRARKIDPDAAVHFAMPTLQELESQVRRRAVGRTIAEICLDLGVTAGLCHGATWSDILQSLMHFGADLAKFFATQQRRRQSFDAERAKRSDCWTVDWRDEPKDVLRELLGTVLGEAPGALA